MIEKIKIVSVEDRLIYHNKVNALPIKEEYILAKSTELFGDDSPCIIYRTFILKALYNEIYEELEKIKKNGINCLNVKDVSDLFININLDMRGATVLIE